MVFPVVFVNDCNLKSFELTSGEKHMLKVGLVPFALLMCERFPVMAYLLLFYLFGLNFYKLVIL